MATDAHTGDVPGLDSQRQVVTSIVLPTHNEAANVEPLYHELASVIDSPAMGGFRPVEIIFVDDSDDETPMELRELAAVDPRVRIVFLRRQWGQSPALAAGFDHAQGEYIVPMDADGQNDPADIPLLLKRVQAGYDCVSGWRRNRRDPWHKTIPSAIQTRLAKHTGPDINDFGCTLKAYRASALEEIDLYGEGHRYIPAKLHKLGYAIDELKVNHRPRSHGSSRYGAGRLLRGFVDLVFHAFWNRYSSRPLHLLGGLGVVLLAAGLLIGSHAVVLKFFFDVSLLPRLPRLVLTVACLVLGVLLLMFGVLAEMLTKLYYRDETEYRVAEVVE